MNHKRLKLTQSATKNPGQMSEASSIPRVEAQAAATQWTAVDGAWVGSNIEA